jgi:hypothetical protein
MENQLIYNVDILPVHSFMEMYNVHYITEYFTDCFLNYSALIYYICIFIEFHN